MGVGKWVEGRDRNMCMIIIRHLSVVPLSEGVFARDEVDNREDRGQGGIGYQS